MLNHHDSPGIFTLKLAAGYILLKFFPRIAIFLLICFCLFGCILIFREKNVNDKAEKTPVWIASPKKEIERNKERRSNYSGINQSQNSRNSAQNQRRLEKKDNKTL